MIAIVRLERLREPALVEKKALRRRAIKFIDLKKHRVKNFMTANLESQQVGSVPARDE